MIIELAPDEVEYLIFVIDSDLEILRENLETDFTASDLGNKLTAESLLEKLGEAYE